MINFSKWIPSSDGSSTFSNFLNWLNTLLENIVNFINDEPIIIGTYVGDGTESSVINLGFTPIAVEVYGSDGAQVYTTSTSWIRNYYGGLAIKNNPCTTYNNDKPMIEIIDNGFKVYSGDEITISGSGIQDTWDLNSKDIHYFIAYKKAQIMEIK